MDDKINSNFGGLNEEEYTSRINTPSKSSLYFEKFHKPLVNRAKGRNDGKPISLVDIACGYAHELDFIKGDLGVNLLGVDISDKVLVEARKRLPQAKFFTYDVRRCSLPYDRASIDAAIAVNAVVYCPDDMLGVIFESLKPNGEAVVNFKNFSNPYNRPFYEFYVADGGVISDQELKIGDEKFALKVLDYQNCREEKVRLLDRQVYFQSTADICRFIMVMGFEVVSHQTFHFRSPANPDNEMDVYTIKKPGLKHS